MAGERLAKLTIRASWAIADEIRADQTSEVRFRLGGSWITYHRGADPYRNEFVVPDPDDGLGHGYVKAGVTNLISLLRATVQQQGLPYVVSDPRETSDDPIYQLPRVDFDITCLSYDTGLDLDFFCPYPGVPSGWQVLENLSTLRPLRVAVFAAPAGVYGSATGNISVVATEGNGYPYTFAWDDDHALPPDTDARENLVPGTYRCVVTDGQGVNVAVTAVVGSDPRLDVLVTTTESSAQLTVSGGLPPYAYAWDDGPTTAGRTGLASGSYPCLVTDARGAQQLVVAVIAPYRFYWSQNPVELALDAGDAYRLDPTTKPNLSFLCEVWLEADYLSGVFAQVGGPQEQPADPQGRTTFDVQALLDPYLAEHLPPLGADAALRADSLFRRFYLRHAEKFGTPPLAEPVSTGQQHYVVLGGLSDEEAAAGTWFQGYQAGAKPFLTWEPNDQAVLPAQPAYLYYMHDTFALDEFRVWRRARLADGTQQDALVATVAGVRRFEVFCLRVGPAALGLAGPDVLGYEVWVASAAGVLLSEVRRFALDHEYYPQQRFFHYTNSLGGVNVLAAFGAATLGLEVSATEAERAAGGDPLLGDTVVLDRAGAPTLSVATGPRRRAQLYADQDALLSRRVTLLNAGQYWPGRIKAATFAVGDETQGVATLAFDFILNKQRRFGPRLPTTPAGQPVAPVAGGEGARP